MYEIFKDIKGYEGLYQVSNLGRVKSFNRGKERILKPCLDRYGYFHVTLSKNGKQKGCTIHRLVATTFIPNPNNLPQINHIDGNKTNNKIENLEWCTAQENVTHRDIINPRVNKIEGINILTGEAFIFQNAKLAGDFVGGNNTNVIKVCKGKKKTYKGFKWRYL